MMLAIIKKLGVGVVGDGEELADRGTPEFYREQVSRLMRVAETMADANGRLELLDIATVFQRLADRATATIAKLSDVSGRQSA